MEGASQTPFVRAVNSLGLVRRWMTPFLRVSEACCGEKKVREFLAPYLESGLPVTAQIMGTRGDVLGELAVKCLEAGASGIDLNCGCPSKRVISRNAGGGALKDPLLLAETVKTIRRVIGPGTPFSVKMRTGFSDPEEMTELIPRLADAGIDKFFVHFRTVREQYLPVPGRTERLKKAVTAASPLPVVVNGDITDAEDGLTLLGETGAAGLMIARGLLRDPWLLRRFEETNVPSPEEGRRRFFAALETFDARGGNKLELARMIWGEDSREFRALCGQPI